MRLHRKRGVRSFTRNDLPIGFENEVVGVDFFGIVFKEACCYFVCSLFVFPCPKLVGLLFVIGLDVWYILKIAFGAGGRSSGREGVGCYMRLYI